MRRVDCTSGGCCQHTVASFMFFCAHLEDNFQQWTDPRVAPQSTEGMLDPAIDVQMAMGRNTELVTSTGSDEGGDTDQHPTSSVLS